MAASKQSPSGSTVDGTPEDLVTPVVTKRSTFQTDMERIQSGGLDDDPTASGEPVRNRQSFKNLKGGR